MQLHSYLKQTGQSQGDFGHRLKPVASQGLVSQWCRGKTRITLDYALQIQVETGGLVTPHDCNEMFTAPEAQPEGAPS